MGGKSTKADSKQFEDMNLNNGDEEDGCHQSNAVAQDSGRMDCSMSQGQDMNSQPATQPLDGSFEMEEGGHMEGVWGQLYSHSGTFPRLALKQEMFRLGRAMTSDYVIRESDMGGSKWLNAVSKCQCEIVKNSSGVFLRDKSSNGTWVNGNKVGKDKMWPLEHNAEICFAGSNKKVFLFMSMEATSDCFPPELTTMYTTRLGSQILVP